MTTARACVRPCAPNRSEAMTWIIILFCDFITIHIHTWEHVTFFSCRLYLEISFFICFWRFLLPFSALHSWGLFFLSGYSWQTSCWSECEAKMFKVHISTTTQYFHESILVFLSAQFRAYCWSHVHLQCWRSVKWSSRTLWIIIDFMLKLLRSHSLDLTFGNLQFWDHTFWHCWHVVCIWYIRVIRLKHFEFKCVVCSFGFIKWCFVFDILASDVK